MAATLMYVMLMWGKRCCFVFSYPFSRLHSSSSPWLINFTSGTKYSFDAFVLQTQKNRYKLELMGYDLSAGAVRAVRWVIFENPDPCALQGSLVEFGCSYDCSEHETVTDMAWYKGGKKRWPLDPCSTRRPSFFPQPLCITWWHDSLAIHDLQENDTGYYDFHFDTDADRRRSKTSLYLSVTGEISTLSVSPSVELFRFSNQRGFFCLEVKASVHPSSTVRAGWGVWLNCQTSCQDRLIWFKDGQPITSTEFQVQIKDAENCTCVVEREELLQSDPVTLDVQCKDVKYSVWNLL